MNSTQKLETVGISYSTVDIFRLIDSGWSISYDRGKMSAWRIMPQHENEEQLQQEEKK